MITGGYNNNTESKSGGCTKYVPGTGGVQTRTRMIHYQPRDNKSKSKCMQQLEFMVCLRQDH